MCRVKKHLWRGPPTSPSLSVSDPPRLNTGRMSVLASSGTEVLVDEDFHCHIITLVDEDFIVTLVDEDVHGVQLFEDHLYDPSDSLLWKDPMPPALTAQRSTLNSSLIPTRNGNRTHVRADPVHFWSVVLPHDQK